MTDSFSNTWNIWIWRKGVIHLYIASKKLIWRQGWNKFCHIIAVITLYVHFVLCQDIPWHRPTQWYNKKMKLVSDFVTFPTHGSHEHSCQLFVCCKSVSEKKLFISIFIFMHIQGVLETGDQTLFCLCRLQLSLLIKPNQTYKWRQRKQSA